MDILTSLGVDRTLWIQLACFIVSYIAFTRLILKPYQAAYAERESRTVGSEETAVRLIEQASELQSQYEMRAKAINSEIKAIYDQSRAQASKQSEGILAGARDMASAELSQARTKISEEIQVARRSLSAEIPAVSAAIASKLAGKDFAI